jgi:hypothetical protein
MIWVIELVVLLAFVGFGGFEGFIAWAVLTALIMFARHSSNQTKLKAAELAIRAEQATQREARERQKEPALPPAPTRSGPSNQTIPAHQWLDENGSVLDFRTMTWGTKLGPASYMARRISATQWEMKYDADFRRSQITALKGVLALPPVEGPEYQPCDECRASGVLELHLPSCSKYDEAAEKAARARREDENMRDSVEDALKRLEREPAWEPFPEKLIAPIETGYQRYLAAK